MRSNNELNILVQGDSQLVINQMSGKFKVKSDNLVQINKECLELGNLFKSIKYEHIPRNNNKIADSLIEGYVLQLQKQKDLSSGAGGFIISAMRNSVVDYFTEDKNSLIQKLEDTIGEFLCPKLSKLSGTITDKAEDLKAKMAS